MKQPVKVTIGLHQESDTGNLVYLVVFYDKEGEMMDALSTPNKDQISTFLDMYDFQPSAWPS